eukprot:CAMPEP_0183324820 /NCGR_PEP_ID=MMETSP0160_2-20130417/78035_1 /TAXON_ID=2839 ORGANISM="Odontella Sinensis, Strain Grunow 1884" /NCGR_SAMPLE_ID=MMETSP0160_2 /ASSEMBLY_ACC=CAM_ASM_000250 /LENGTH=388 /DNA_ID=CAMNT_0025492489 /DNA_START=11 /DNA_END=1177 /DNA_ORIENTATION=-
MGDRSDASVLACPEENESKFPPVTLVAKFGKEKIELSSLPPSTTIGQVKTMLTERTGVLPKRQKLIGLSLRPGSSASLRSKNGGSPPDEAQISELKIKAIGKKGAKDGRISHQFILMGTPEEEIFVDPHEKEDLPEVVDDFDLDFNAGSDEWLQHVANGENLRKFTEATAVHIMNKPREGKPLLVLDLDHTLLDFSSKSLQRANSFVVGDESAAKLKRPHMDEFLTSAYKHYDLCVWSQTSWRWLEVKLTELGMLTSPTYRFCFVLDKTSMFKIVSMKRDGTRVEHHVKPLQIIWSKFPRWGSHNTVHLDDLSRNFALNIGSGLKVTGYYRKKSSARKDCELLGIARYLEELAAKEINFDNVDFSLWADVISGKRSLVKDDSALSKKT